MIKTLDSLKYELNPDCVKFCPFENYNDLLLVGLYFLKDKEKQTVVGGFTLFQIKDQKLLEIQVINDNSGVLDLIWYKDNQENLQFLCACVDGQIQLYSYNKQNNQITQNHTINLNDKCLYIDVLQNQILVGLNQGNFAQLEINENEIKIKKIWEDHLKFSVWCCAFQQSKINKQENLFLVGGDDCKMMLFDQRMDDKIQMNSKIHQMGLTHIQFNPNNSNIFSTCSYDQYLRIFDIRNLKNEISEIYQDGAIWRGIWNPNEFKQIVIGVYTSHKYQILEFDDQYKLQEIGNPYENHDSLAYGVDWQFGQTNTLASISFYDQIINLWQISQ